MVWGVHTVLLTEHTLCDRCALAADLYRRVLPMQTGRRSTSTPASCAPSNAAVSSAVPPRSSLLPAPHADLAARKLAEAECMQSDFRRLFNELDAEATEAEVDSEAEMVKAEAMEATARGSCGGGDCRGANTIASQIKSPAEIASALIASSSAARASAVLASVQAKLLDIMPTPDHEKNQADSYLRDAEQICYTSTSYYSIAYIPPFARSLRVPPPPRRCRLQRWRSCSRSLCEI